MKKYLLKENSKAGNKIIKKGTELISNGYVDENGGILCIVKTGEYKGSRIVFDIGELEEFRVKGD